MIAAAEMAELRVRLVDLPGFDPTGLHLYDASGALGVLSGIDDDLYWFAGGVTRRRIDSCSVSTADARTRDALARWVAERVGAVLGCTAPTFQPEPHDNDGWLLDVGDDEPYWWPQHGPGDATIVAGFDTLRVEDDRRLPDGSRWVDAAALAAVARHVGGAK